MKVGRCTETLRRLVGYEACKLRLGGRAIGVGSGKLSQKSECFCAGAFAGGFMRRRCCGGLSRGVVHRQVLYGGK